MDVEKVTSIIVSMLEDNSRMIFQTYLEHSVITKMDIITSKEENVRMLEVREQLNNLKNLINKIREAANLISTISRSLSKKFILINQKDIRNLKSKLISLGAEIFRQ